MPFLLGDADIGEGAEKGGRKRETCEWKK